MSPRILGLDISSFAIHGAYLAPGEGHRTHCEILGKRSTKPVWRIRNVGEAFSRMLEWAGPVDWVSVEIPIGEYANVQDALNRVVGAITASTPEPCQVNWHRASEWRHILGVKNTKAAGHAAVFAWLYPGSPLLADATGGEYDEHELDALGVALALRVDLAAKAAA